MNKILTILLLIITTNFSYSQIDSTKLDTIRLYVHALDTVHYYNYYNSNGVLAWGNVKGYDATLIPSGGYVVMGNYVNSVYSIINGYGVIRWTTTGKLDEVIKWLDATKKEIKDKWVSPELIIR